MKLNVENTNKYIEDVSNNESIKETPQHDYTYDMKKDIQDSWNRMKNAMIEAAEFKLPKCQSKRKSEWMTGALHHCVQTGSGIHQASYPMGTRGSFPGCEAAEA
jgi:hypothetical protein